MTVWLSVYQTPFIYPSLYFVLFQSDRYPVMLQSLTAIYPDVYLMALPIIRNTETIKDVSLARTGDNPII